MSVLPECRLLKARSSTYRSTALSSGIVEMELSPKSIITCNMHMHLAVEKRQLSKATYGASLQDALPDAAPDASCSAMHAVQHTSFCQITTVNESHVLCGAFGWCLCIQRHFPIQQCHAYQAAITVPHKHVGGCQISMYERSVMHHSKHLADLSAELLFFCGQPCVIK